MDTKKVLLVLGGILSFCAAAFQFAIGLVPAWSAFFDAPATLLNRPALLLTAGAGVAILLAIWGFYGFSGAGLIRRLPLLRLGLFIIGAIYIFRGLPVIFFILAQLDILSPAGAMEFQNLLVTLGALVAGTCYWAGLVVNWTRLGQKAVAVNA